MKRSYAFALLVWVGAVTCLVSASPACKPGDAKTANDSINGFLNTAAYACTQESTIQTVPELAIACGIVNVADKIAPEVEAFLETLILGRQQMIARGMKFSHVGMRWVKP